MSDYSQEEWSKLPPLDKTKYFASVGDVNTVIHMVESGALDKLSEAESRGIVSQAFQKSAELRDRQTSQGLYSKQEWEDLNLQEAGANFSRNQRARALEVRLNPEGLDLKDQLKNIFSPKK